VDQLLKLPLSLQREPEGLEESVEVDKKARLGRAFFLISSNFKKGSTFEVND